MDPDQKRIARAALARAQHAERQVEQDYPGCWRQLDDMRATRGQQVTWPDWCLLPMGAAAALAQTRPHLLRGHTIALMSALHAWRYARSVWMVQPELADRLLTQVPDAVGVSDFTGLPEWCVYIAAGPDTGMWAHLEYDLNTSRPELRLLLEPAPGEYVPIPVYLDRPSITEALGDYAATALASAGTTGADVRGGPLTSTTAELAAKIDGYIGLLTYLTRPEALLTHATRPGVTPVKPRRPKQDADIWIVGGA